MAEVFRFTELVEFDKTKEVQLRGEPKGGWCFEPQVNEAMIRMGGLPSRTP